MKIICIGDLCADLLLPYGEVKNHIRQLKQGNVDYSEVVFQQGGTCGNTSVVLGKLGAHPYFVTELCTDPIGMYLRKTMEDSGVDLSLSKATQGKSNMICIAVIDEDKERTVFPWLPPGSDYPLFNADNLSLIPEEEAMLVFTGGMVMNNDVNSMDAVCEKVERLHQSGSKVIFDLNVRAETYGMSSQRKQAYERMIAASDIIIGSGIEEFASVTDERTIEQAVNRLAENGHAVIARDGKEPVIVAEGDRRERIKTRSVSVLQTIGAGDTFNGAFLYALKEGSTLCDAVRFANDIASYMISTPGHLSVPSDYQQRLEQIQRQTR